jgi:hypothetical protein
MYKLILFIVCMKLITVSSYGQIDQKTVIKSDQESQVSFTDLKEKVQVLDIFPSIHKPLFKKRGFYLHGGWRFNYPFSVRSWKREDYDHMFKLLKLMGFNQVGLWPLLEAIPMP